MTTTFLLAPFRPDQQSISNFMRVKLLQLFKYFVFLLLIVDCKNYNRLKIVQREIHNKLHI